MNEKIIIKKLSEISKEILLGFVGIGEIIINTAINPYEALRYGTDGATDYYQSVNNLKKNNYLKTKKIKNKTYYKLTPKGKKTVLSLILANKIKSKKWNGKWYILIFDIPESKRGYRDNLRKTLLNIGFYQMQKSVWIFPYDVIEYLYEILPGFREGDWFEYMEVNNISSYNELVEYFNLNK